MKKKKFKIEITEVSSRVVEIEADTAGIAIETVIQKYKSEKIVLDWNDFIETNIDIFGDDKLFQNYVNNTEFRDFVLNKADTILTHLSIEELSKLAFSSYVNAIEIYKNQIQNNG